MEKYLNETFSVEERVEDLLSRLTLEEKCAQMIHSAVGVPRLGIHPYNWWNEALHGVARAGTATVFPQCIALGASFNAPMALEIAKVISDEGRAKYNEQSKHGDCDIYKGLTYWTPNINIFRDPRWGRGHETFGEDPYLTTQMGLAFVYGLQGTGKHLKIAACAKHFAVHSGPEELRHEFDAVASPKDMEETYLPAFEALVKKGNVEAVMGAYNRTNGEPCCGSKTLLKDTLRDKWGFKGYVVSDCWAIRDFHENHKVTKSNEESVALALKNGCDINCGCTYEYLMKAYNKKLITKEDIDNAMRWLLSTWFKLGMFDEKTEFDNIPYSVVACKEHRELAVQAAEQSIVLLKNNGILPLKKDINTIGVIGPNADSREAMLGNYTGTPIKYVTALEGIMNEAEQRGIRVLYSEGCHLYKDRTSVLAKGCDRDSEALTVAEQSDVVVLVLGLDATIEGEQGDAGNEYGSGDKPNIKYPTIQQHLLDIVTAVGKPVILLSLTGSAMDMRIADKRCAAILQGWYPGAEGGTAIANILFGIANPSGKLPVTFYRSDDDLPEFVDYAMKNRTYRYFDGTPLYPFGYGLSYTTFTYEGGGEAVLTDSVRVSVKVKNTGSIAGYEKVQVYAEPINPKCVVPRFELKAFMAIYLEAGQEMRLTFTVSSKSLQLVDDARNRFDHNGGFKIYVGGGQPDARTAELTGTTPVVFSVR